MLAVLKNAISPLATVTVATGATDQGTVNQATPLDESLLNNELLTLLAALRNIPKTAKMQNHSASSVVGFGLRHNDSGIDAGLGRMLAAEWDRTTGGESTAVFDKSDPAYSHTSPVTKASIFKLAKEHGWKGDIPWSKPQDLTAKIDPEPYPIDALPENIRAAVEEVAGFVKSPIPLVVGSALGALSVVAQAHVDIKRAERLSGPVSIMGLGVADSGERKTTGDNFFTAPIREYEAEQAALAKPLIKEYEAKLAGWSAEKEGILAAIKQAGKSGKQVGELQERVSLTELDKPEAPRIPRLILGDETPENLAYTLAKNWPSAGVISSEAGVVFGAHGMGKDSAMRNMALLNVLWDGGELPIGRRTSESFTVRGARLTMALQVQEATLRAFLDKSGGLARGTGFLARFLFYWPQSTQGYRPFTEPPDTWPRLTAFHRRLTEILNTPAPLTEQGTLEPTMLTFTPEAKQDWIEFHDAIEVELRSGGELYDVRDVASKTADNAARLAALFHVFTTGLDGEVDVDSFEGASRIAAWHLSEARRFLGELALHVELANAARLDTWLLEYCRNEQTSIVPRREAQRCGPIRDSEALNKALQELVELGRVRIVAEGRRKDIEINPALLASGEQ